MRWASAVSENPNFTLALESCVAGVRAGLDGAPADLAVAFVSPHFSAQFARIPRSLRDRLGAALIFGCSAGGVIGAGHEVEDRPALSLTAGHLPGVQLTPFRVTEGELPSEDAPPGDWERLVGAERAAAPHFLLLSDPYSFEAERLLAGLDYAFPAGAKIGGLASAAARPGGNALYLVDEAFDSGAVGVALTGNIAVDTVVAQGCRPIGQPMRITRCERNLLQELDGQPPMEVLQRLYEAVAERDRRLFRNSLFLGIVMDELQERHRIGDFLIRNLVGMDRATGALAVGAHLREHQTVQFHLRDAETASEDLRSMLSQYLSDADPAQAEGALLFQCSGRGSYLYGRPDHDTEIFREHLGPVPMGGFFCAGEIGQVGGSTYLHGYTSSFGIFRSLGPE
jgi:small ligand-binding sensory domain FIST